MNKIKIGIVEDENIIADDLQILLEEIGYLCPEPCSNYKEAIIMLSDEVPELVLLDINLAGKPDGIRIAQFIRATMNMPFIFLTANSDMETVNMAKDTRPDAYLVKPFQKADLHTAIEIALHNFNYNRQQQSATQEKKVNTSDLFIKDGEYFFRVPLDEILYISSEHVYVAIHTLQRKFLVRAALQGYIEQLDPSIFVRVHRSYVANVKKIEKINSQNVIVNNTEIPISKHYRDDLHKMLNLA
jgi:two-component system response regulator LytT